VQKEVGTIVIKGLKHIRETFHSLNRADRNFHSWSFYQLQNFIKYKVKLAGIKVKNINDKNTSQCCSKCGKVKKLNAKESIFMCI
jgi:IS605 OrfB family transposase